MRLIVALAVCAGLYLVGVSGRQAFDRQPAERFDAPRPSTRVTGPPGRMAIAQRECRSHPEADIRRRIVLLAAQEWGFFGYAIVDRIDDGRGGPEDWRGPRGRRRVDPIEATRVAASIGGYWTVTPDGAWILDSQNTIWRRPDNEAARWRYAWSAAFISWVMCESGLAGMDQFQRDVAHHRYIDQAIRAHAGDAPRAAFVAQEPGGAAVVPGDLLCTARRPAYRTLAERRRQMGEGARTHCDVVVRVDQAAGRVLAIGGNVRGTVGLKALPLVSVRGTLRVADPTAGSRAPTVFAHLKLRPVYTDAADVFEESPAVRALGCLDGQAPASWRAAVVLVAGDRADCAS